MKIRCIDSLFLSMLSILCQLFVANTAASLLSSIFALRNDISNHNNIVKGNNPENEIEVISMRFEKILGVNE